LNNCQLNGKTLWKGGRVMTKKDEYLTNSPAREQVSIQSSEAISNSRNVPGDSVEGHKELELANAILTGDEIKQQNENL
jgi:hypothetical protein